MRILTEEEIDHLESLIPQLAVSATQQAYVAALAAGHSVTEVVDGRLVMTQSSGAKKVVGQARPKTRVEVGVIHEVKRIKAM